MDEDGSARWVEGIPDPGNYPLYSWAGAPDGALACVLPVGLPESRFIAWYQLMVSWRLPGSEMKLSASEVLRHVTLAEAQARALELLNALATLYPQVTRGRVTTETTVEFQR